MNKYKIVSFSNGFTDIRMIEASDMLAAIQQSGMMMNTIVFCKMIFDVDDQAG